MHADALITFVYTRSLAGTAPFYEDALGLELALDQGGCRIYRVAADAYVGVCERSDAPSAPSGVILTLVSDDVDAWHDRLRAAGATIEKAPARNDDFGIYHCFARDPNGYLIEVQRFLDPDWATGGRRA